MDPYLWTLWSEKFKFDEFNAARNYLASASKLKLYFRTDESSNTGAMNDIQRECDIIERIESEDIKNSLGDEFRIEFF